MTLLLLFLAPLTLLPRRWWRPIAIRVCHGLMTGYFKDRTYEFVASVPEVLVELSHSTRAKVAENFLSRTLYSYIEVLAAAIGLYKPRSVRLAGTEQIREAMEAGRGVILWVEQAFSYSLLVKVAVAQAGFQLHHISRPTHGGTNTRFGMKFIAAITRRAEAPYLAERIMLSGSQPVRALRHTQQLLKAGQVVSITVADTASQLIEVPALKGLLRLPTGAPHLAYATGAAILPVFSHWEGDVFVAEVGPPIAPVGANRDDALRGAAEAFAQRLTGYVTSHPLDWAGYFWGCYTPGSTQPASSS